MKFSLLTLLGAVAIAAVGCAALAHPVQGWAMAVFTAAVLLLSSAVIAAIYCQAAARAFWLGFAIPGWIYLLLVWVCLEKEVTPTRDGRILATTWILDELADGTVEPQKPDADSAKYYSYTGSSEASVKRTSARPYGFIRTPDVKVWHCLLQIGHALWALSFAFAGGVLGRWLYARQERRGHP